MRFKLAQLREKSALTQEDVAKAAGVSAKTEWNWEKGKSYPNASQLFAICDVLNCDPNELLGWWDDHPRETEASYADPWQGELNRCYEASTSDRKRRIVDTARDAALASGDAAERDDAGSESVAEGA